jgi:hypothetical protein
MIIEEHANRNSHLIVLSYGNALNFQRKFFPCPMKNRPTDPSEIRVLEFKGQFRRRAICSVLATIGDDWLNFAVCRGDCPSSSDQKNTVSARLRHSSP